MKRFLRVPLLVSLFVWCSLDVVCAGESDTGRLTRDLGLFCRVLSGNRTSFSLTVDGEAPIDGRVQRVALRLERHDEQSFDFEAKYAEYWLRLRRRADMTALELPQHDVAFVGRGMTDKNDQLSPQGITSRLMGPGSLASAYLPLLQEDPAATALLLTGLLKIKSDPAAGRWTVGQDAWFKFGEQETSLTVGVKGAVLRLTVADQAPTRGEQPASDLKEVAIPRVELERQLARGLRRALEILAPSPLLTSPAETDKKTPHGELRWIGGQRVALLEGTPEQVGRAHGELLREEANRCIDSVLCVFGTVETIRTGRWFPNELEAAYERLAPHIPDRHKREMTALAAALGLEPRLMERLNVFPEMFHCSGFAAFGKATKDGKLYHGRVLDYMTAIGLQDAATTFVVKADGRIPFANVGYAGFVGSVSGMNAQGISLGEMGGRGEGKWDGAPMATLMRRGLEECSRLDEVIELWKSSPRTCEYYYVFADGKSNRAVGVAAVPESVEFVLPGQSHPQLGDGIADAVVVSAGSRLETLRERVRQRHGQIDAEVGQWLMSRPVAMQSNLHNVLFVPADGVLYVANADHKRPAAERPYVRLDLHALLAAMHAPAAP